MKKYLLAAAAILFCCGLAKAQVASVAPVAPPSTLAQSSLSEPKWPAYFNGAAYVASTNSIQVPAGGYATVTFCNISTNKTTHIFWRRFDNNVPAGTAPLLYAGVSGTTSTSISSTPAAYSSVGPTTSTSYSNLLNTSPASTSVALTYGAGTASVSGSTTATGYLLTPGPYALRQPRGLGPGTCQGQFVRNGSATTAYAVSFTFYWWEQ